MSDREAWERRVYRELTRHGGGGPVSAIADPLWLRTVEAIPAGMTLAESGLLDLDVRHAVALALRRLQTKGWAFNHDVHGSLGVWGGIGSKARYWSTRRQVQRTWGYGDDLLPATKGPEPAS